ncbi:MAG: N-acetyltransferase, partial [Actinobacteria bacterium]|nr:N-acetyltransferase [Actinomycetota bacterium]
GYELTAQTRPFPYETLADGDAQRDDLYFSVLRKTLTDLA